jgi:hypothetical protein
VPVCPAAPVCACARPGCHGPRFHVDPGPLPTHPVGGMSMRSGRKMAMHNLRKLANRSSGPI